MTTGAFAGDFATSVLHFDLRRMKLRARPEQLLQAGVRIEVRHRRIEAAFQSNRLHSGDTDDRGQLPPGRFVARIEHPCTIEPHRAMPAN